MSSLLHICAYSPKSACEHGGVRRSMQLCAVAEQKGGEIVIPISPTPANLHFLLRPFALLKSIRNIFRIGIFYFSFKGFLIALLQGAWLAIVMERNEESVLWIEVAPNRSMLLAALISASDRSYIAFPHNVEFLVPSHCQGYFSGRGSEFFIEQYVYTRASRVCAISEFDAAVIRSLGVNSVDVLSYAPVGPQREELLLIRGLRESSEKSYMLILGTVGNLPTRIGIDHLLRLIALECSQPSSPAREYKLAGYGTEVFRDMAPSAVVVLGSVSKEVLRELMVSCSALLVSQPQTSGMLTRIVEAEVAGIPVYVHGHYIQAWDPALKETKIISSLCELP
jgi:glycosyltransferase involved in cell wall biosynthesis